MSRGSAGHVGAAETTGALRAGWREQQVAPFSAATSGTTPKVVWQQAHTLGLKRVVISERAALFTDLPQMRVEH